MTRRILFSALVFAATAAVSIAATVPRPSPEYSFTSSTGERISVSQFRGKVVALEFLLTTCPHCQVSAQALETLHKKYKGRFQPLGVAINDNAAALVGPFKKQFGITFPVGWTADRMSVIHYLQHPMAQRFMMPQLVLIDQKGVIRYQFAGDDPALENPDKTLPAIVEKLVGK